MNEQAEAIVLATMKVFLNLSQYRYFELFYKHNLNTKEIAVKMDVSMGAIYGYRKNVEKAFKQHNIACQLLEGISIVHEKGSYKSGQ